MRVKGTLTIDVWYNATDLDEVENELSDVMNDVVRRYLLCANETTSFNGPYMHSYAHRIDTEIVT